MFEVWTEERMPFFVKTSQAKGKFLFKNIFLIEGRAFNVEYCGKLSSSFDCSELVNLRERVELLCQAGGEPQPEILWWRAGRPVTGDSNMAVYNNNTAGRFNDGPSLVIQAVTMRDLGDFTCLARNGATSTREKTFSLELAGPQVVEKVKVESLQINSGGRVTLACPLSSGSAEFAVLWYRREGGQDSQDWQDLRPFYVFNSDQESDWVGGDQQEGWHHRINKKIFSLGWASANVLPGGKNDL